MSNVKTNARIEVLSAIENRSKQQSIYLASASCKIDNKTASQRYNQISKSPFLAEILGDCPMPSYYDFLMELPVKKDGSQLYSEIDAFRTIGRIAKKFVAVDTTTIESVLEVPVIVAPIITAVKVSKVKSATDKAKARAKRQQSNTNKK
jgi:hypothetical protein